MTRSLSPRRSTLALWGLFVMLLSTLFALAPSTALAKGTVTAEKAAVDEVEETWKFSFIIDNGTMPDIQFVPVLISFEPVVLYERSLTDESGEKPVITKKQLQNQKTIDVGTDISFSDGTGQMFKKTKFRITLTRAKGFEAGEYQMVIKKSDGGEQLGGKVRLTLNGENKIVDRRSITFVGEDPNKKKKPMATPDATKTDAPAGEADVTKDEPEPQPAGDPLAAEQPPAVEPKQGGCGCEVPAHTSANVGVAGLMLAGALLLRRRRSRVRSASAPRT